MCSCEMSISQSSGAVELLGGSRLAHAPGPTPPPSPDAGKPPPLLLNPAGGGSAGRPVQGWPAAPLGEAPAAAGSMLGPLVLVARPRGGITGGGMRSNRCPSCSSRLSPTWAPARGGIEGSRASAFVHAQSAAAVSTTAPAAACGTAAAGCEQRCCIAQAHLRYAKPQGSALPTSPLQPSTTNTSNAKPSVVLNTCASRMFRPRSP
jgi:hypothetical protein